MRERVGVKKRTFKDLRRAILFCLANGQHTINQISYKTRINWRTVEAHLTYLVGKGLVVEVLSLNYVRVFELSDKGKAQMEMIGVEVNGHNNKIVDENSVRMNNNGGHKPI